MAEIKANFSSLQQKAQELSQAFTELEAAITKANAAGASAVSAAGGAGTGVGAAIQEVIVDVSAEQLGQSRTQLEEMIGNLGKVANQYSSVNEKLIANIKKLAANNQGSGGGSGSGTAGNLGGGSHNSVSSVALYK